MLTIYCQYFMCTNQNKIQLQKPKEKNLTNNLEIYRLISNCCGSCGTNQKFISEIDLMNISSLYFLFLYSDLFNTQTNSICYIHLHLNNCQSYSIKQIVCLGFSLSFTHLLCVDLIPILWTQWYWNKCLVQFFYYGLDSSV